MKRIVRFLFRSHTLFQVALLRLSGKKIRIGKQTVIFPGARLYPSKGTIIIGDNCFIFRGATLRAWTEKIVIGNNVSINDFAVLHGISRLYVGNDCRIASHVAIIPADHTFDDLTTPIRKQPLKRRGIYIGSNVWIGAGAKILDGVRIAPGSVIGAGAIVTKSTVRDGVYVGNPARLLRLRGQPLIPSDRPKPRAPSA